MDSETNRQQPVEAGKRTEPEDSKQALLEPRTESPPPKKRGFLKRFLWPLAKGVLYVVFLVAVVVAISGSLEWMAKFVLKHSMLKFIYPNDISMVRKDFTRPVSHYDYDFVPGICLEYNLLKGNSYEYANNAGFRYPQDIALEKPADEFRVFLVGGSTAYGLGAIGEAAQAMNFYGIPYNETISHMMERILNATAPVPGKKIRVYNTAVWGYAYQHHLMRYAAKLRRYKPDMVISFDGANEIAPICKLSEDWDYFQEGQFNAILQDIYSYNRRGLMSYLTLWLKNNTYLMTFFWGGKDIFQEILMGMNPESQKASSDSPDADQKHKPDAKVDPKVVEAKSRLADRNVAAVVRVVEDFHSALENDGVPHIIAIQPWFYLSKKKQSEQEKTLAKLDGHREIFGVPSVEMYKLLIERMSYSARNKGYFLVDFCDYFDDVSEWVFTDWCHLTAGANYLVAKELSNLVKEHFFRMSPNDGDVVQDKNATFLDLAASGKIQYALAPDSEANGTKNMLGGYPGDAMYASKEPADGDRVEVVLDLEETQPVSRMRLVWADVDSVPEQWAVEASADGQTWQTFVQGTNKDTDNYSRWPGFEYYGAVPVQARFLKYKPVAPAKAAVKLRSWSVSR